MFQLYGPLVAWGDISVGEFRPSTYQPSKSAITGLLAAAIGIERNQEIQNKLISESFGVAMCVNPLGELLHDFQTVQVPRGKIKYKTRKDEILNDASQLETILTRRDYHTDTFCKVAIWNIKDKETDYSLEEIKLKLRCPKYVLYLGRKSCPPSLPLYPDVLTSVNLKEAFEAYQPSFGNWFKKDYFHQMNLYYWEKGGLSDEEIGMKSTMVTHRRDLVQSRKQWQFLVRKEYFYTEQVLSD